MQGQIEQFNLDLYVSWKFQGLIFKKTLTFVEVSHLFNNILILDNLCLCMPWNGQVMFSFANIWKSNGLLYLDISFNGQIWLRYGK